MAANDVKLRLSVDGAAAVLSDFDKVRSGMSGVSSAATKASAAMRTAFAGIGLAAMTGWIKSAINAADQTAKLSQKIGVATKDIAGLQLAFKQAGAAESFAVSMAKMSKSVADGSKAFAAMGINTKAADGALKSTRVILGEVADKMASYRDGVAKSALAQEIFGRSGAELIPLLNGGAESLSAFDDMARKLGLTLSESTAKEAEKFNDTLSLMGQSSQGVARQIAAQLLPTLSGLAGQFFESMTSGDKLKNTADFLASSLKVLYIAGLGVVEAFKTVGTTLGGVSAIIVAALSGDFAGAVNIFKSLKTDIGSGWTETAAEMSKAWNATGNAAVEAMAATQSAAKATAPVLASMAKASKAAADAAKAKAAAMKAAAKADVEAFKAMDALRKEGDKQIKTVTELLDKIEFETRLLELNTEQRALATMERELERQGIVKTTEAYDDYIDKLREAMSIKTSKEESIRAADEMRQAQQKAAEASGKYWEDALMRAFEAGKGFFQSLWDTIKNTLKTQVLKVMVSATGVTGMSAAGATDLLGGGGAGNLMGTASTLGTMYNTITGGFTKLTATVSGNLQYAADWMMTSQSDLVASLGESLSANVGTLSTAVGYAAGAAAGLALGKTISGGYSAIGGGSGNTAVNAGTAIGAIVGGPLGAAVGGAIGGLVNRAFGRGPTQLTASGTRGTFSGDEFNGVNYANYKKKGGWFRSDKNWTETSALSAEMKNAWSGVFADVKGSVAAMAASVGLSTDKILSYSKYIDIAAGTTEAQVAAIFTGMADAMATAAAPGLAAFKQTGETASVTLARLSTNLQAANFWMNVLGQTAFDVSLTGADAANRLADVFGGLENMALASKAYYDLFWTEAERLADTQTNVAKGLALVGVAMPTTKDAYRDLVSSLDLTTEAGRNAYAVMLALAPEFAQVADAIAASVNTVFDSIENSLSKLQQNIASERDLVADARASILQKAPKTAAQLATEIAAVNVTMSGVLDYAAAMTQYSGDAEKAVKVLSQLRVETVAYYEAQKELAGLMQTSAAGLRNAAQALGASLLNPAQSVAVQRAEFAKNYSMALAIDGTKAGALKSAYADKMTAALPGLSEAIKATSSTQEWALASARLAAQSIAVADLLASDAAGMNFEADSLALLDSIDVTLMELDSNTAILKNAIDNGTATSAAGLRAIVTQLGGVPAFAGGGTFTGGLRLVGEHGPELEVTGPSRIYSNNQTRGLLSAGANPALLEELRALRKEVAALHQSNSRENTAIMTHAALTADATRRMDKNGMLVYTDPADPLLTEVAA